MKTFLLKLPEYYLIMAAILAGYAPPFSINPFFIGIVGILILQILFKNKISGIALGSLFFLINLFFLGALLSEFNEFPKSHYKAKLLLVVGLGIWMLNMFFALLMIYKYVIQTLERNLELKIK